MVLLPGCACCGSTDCQPCTEGTSPDTVTVAFSNIYVRGPDLIDVVVSSCFGSGADARITAPGGDPETAKGAISSISLTSGGGGYATLGRAEPAVSASAPGGSGASLAVNLSQKNDACGNPESWEVASVDVSSAGTGYLDGDSVTFTIAEGDTESSNAAATIHVNRQPPNLTMPSPWGAGATYSLQYQPNGGSPQTWRVSSIVVLSGGSGYRDNTMVDGYGWSLQLGEGDQVACDPGCAFVGRIRTTTSDPVLSVLLWSQSGTGATLLANLAYNEPFLGSEGFWNVVSVDITNGGSGYQVGDPVEFELTEGAVGVGGPASGWTVGEVDENGAITSVAYGTSSGQYTGSDDGVVRAVEIDYGGEYFSTKGPIASVTVSSGGSYYREDASLPVRVSNVEVTLTQSAPSDGTGAEISVTVDDDPDSETFGQITAINIINGGDGYLAWGYEDSPLGWFSGKTFTLAKGVSPCSYEWKCYGEGGCTSQTRGIRFYISNNYLSGYYNRPRIVCYNSVTVDGRPVYSVRSSCNTAAYLVGDKPIRDCETLEAEQGSISYGPDIFQGAGLVEGSSATVAPGGTYGPLIECDNVSADGLNAVGITVNWYGFTFEPQPGPPVLDCVDRILTTCWPPYKSSYCVIRTATGVASMDVGARWVCTEPGRKGRWDVKVRGFYTPTTNPWAKQHYYFDDAWGYLDGDGVYPNGTTTIQPPDQYTVIYGQSTWQTNIPPVTVTFTGAP